MIYFFHHYELPVIIQQAQVQQILRLRTRQRHQQQNGNGATSNNAANLRNGSNTIGNQANNSNAMGGGGGGGVGNLANNGGGGGNNNNPLNNNQRTGTLSLLNPILNTFSSVQGRLINYAFGTAAFSNNNNDNRLNNNNITNNNNNRNNYPTINFTRLRINLNRLRRMNLASGIQINPIEINVRADELPSNVHNERPENVNNGDDDVSGGVATASSVAAASLSAEVNAAGPSAGLESSRTLIENDNIGEHEINPIENSQPLIPGDFDLDFDIIDEIEIKTDGVQLAVGGRHSDDRDVTTMPPSLDGDIQIQSISSLTNILHDEPIHSAPNDSPARSNQSLAFDQAPSNPNDLTSANQRQHMHHSKLYGQYRSALSRNDDDCDDDDDLNYQIGSSECCPNESHHWKQRPGDNPDNSLSNKKIGICDDRAAAKQATETNSLSSQQSDADPYASQSAAARYSATVDPISNLMTNEENRILDKTQSTIAPTIPSSTAPATLTHDNEMTIDDSN